MLRIAEAIVVEGRYDRIKLSSVVEALVIETGGFRIFRDREKRAQLKKLAESCGIVILTDSDTAGFRIRRYLKNIVGPNGKVTNVYIPQIEGIEPRKDGPSREGLIGVEGMSEETLREAFYKAGIGCDAPARSKEITKQLFFELGLTGAKESGAKRATLLKALELPGYMTTNALIELLNVMLTRDEFLDLLERI